MHVHRFERLWFAGALVLIVLFIGTVTYGAVGAGFGMVGDAGVRVDPTDPTASTAFEEPGVYATDGANRYDVYVVARQFRFQPGTVDPIRLPAGSTVTFHVTSSDVTHGFEVVGTNVNVMAIPGEIARVTVEFEEPAEYGLVCHEYCGAGHHDMAGQIVVVPPSEYEGPTGGS